MVKILSPWLTLVASFLETPHIRTQTGIKIWALLTDTLRYLHHELFTCTSRASCLGHSVVDKSMESEI